MDLFPIEIWYQILGQAKFSARTVCSSWLEIIHHHPNFSEDMALLERLHKLPNSIRELIKINRELIRNVACVVQKEFGREHAEITLNYGGLIITFHKDNFIDLGYDDDGIHYVYYEGKGAQLVNHIEFFKEVFHKQQDLDLKPSYLLKKDHFPGARMVLFHKPDEVRIIYPEDINVYIRIREFGVKKDSPPIEFNSINKLIMDMNLYVLE